MECNETQLKFMLSRNFWMRRRKEQLAYIHEIELSDRSAARKLELQLSALDVYKRCLRQLDLIAFVDEEIDRMDAIITAEIKASKAERKRRR